MNILDSSRLEVGDILLVTSPEKVSSVIRFFTGSDVSHAMIYAGNHSVIDSTGDGVQARNIQRLIYDISLSIVVLRRKEALTVKQIDSIMNYARSRIGTVYSVHDAILSHKLLAPFRIPSRRQFCSRLVAMSYANAGINLVDDPRFCTPADLEKSQCLTRVECAYRRATELEVKRAKMSVDYTAKMMQATNEMLSAARTVDSEIQSINDMVQAAMSLNSLDAAIAQAIKGSDYFSVWMVYKKERAWEFELQGFILFTNAMPREDVAAYCKSVACMVDLGRYERELREHQRLCAQCKNNLTLKLFVTLYTNLVKSEEQRLRVVTDYLKHSGA